MVTPRLARLWLVKLNLIVLAGNALIAQTGGPVQSDFYGGGGSGVSEFTGGFSYSIPAITIPGPHGSSFSLALSYSSGASIINGVSWVGYGWSLTPGAIIRQKRGLPDDWKGTIVQWNKREPFYTISGVRKTGVEITSQDLDDSHILPASIGGFSYKTTSRYSNMSGYSDGWGLDAVLSGLGGIGYNVVDDESSFSGFVNPFTIFASLMMTTGVNPNPIAVPPAYLGFYSNDLRVPSRVLSSYTGSSINTSYGKTASIPPFLSGAEWGKEGNLTHRQNEPISTLSGFGYMYSGSNEVESENVLDYYLERDVGYTNDSRLLPVPFNNADRFYVSGSGPGGGFRLFHSTPGEFRPNEIDGSTFISQGGKEIHIGGRWGVGADLGIGINDLDIAGWIPGDTSHWFSEEGDQPCFFRYLGDRGGNLLYSENDNPNYSSLAITAFSQTDTTPARAPLATDIFTKVNRGNRPGQSYSIGYHTNKEMLETTDQGVQYKNDSKSPSFIKWIKRDREEIEEQIGEFVLHDGNGYRYNYGLPVYSRNERDIRIGLAQYDDSIAANRMTYALAHTGNSSIVQGQHLAEPYAAAYLLTSITTPDYVDLTHDGPTPDDIGGYVLFHYVRSAGSDDKLQPDVAGSMWYNWRIPYNGFQFDRGSLFDPKDDMGTFSSGEREVYRLTVIETKTHFASFIAESRLDNYPQIGQFSNDNQALVAGNPSATRASWINEEAQINPSSRLKEIRLFSKLGVNSYRLLQTVHFEHDYSLCPGMPNSLTPHPDSTQRLGVLTLRKLWAESHGKEDEIHSSTIAPYIFGYQYKDSSDYSSLPNAFKGRYSNVLNYANSLSPQEQNPGYNPLNFDRWGNYQYNGQERYSCYNSWVDQTPDTAFDPAAWQLKWIRTPSGGEFHVQYEQSDYAYVQDRSAMVMVSLLDSIETSAGTLLPSDSYSDNLYYINLSDIGIDSTDFAAVSEMKSLIYKHIVDNDRKMYFRFLYALQGNQADVENPEYASEYITGYANTDTVLIHTINPGVNEWYVLSVTLKSEGSYGVPRQACWDYLKKSRRGRMEPGDGVPLTFNASEMLNDLLYKRDRGAFSYQQSEHCKDIDYSNSYVRLPAFRRKLGGGTRVKRILTYDPGIEEGSAKLYGSEYLYQMSEPETGRTISSGVAVNEPMAGREENSLVDVIISEHPSEYREKIIAGEDRAKMEGPLGETILPGPSIGYSRVVVKNISGEATNPGFAVNEFYTAKDFPFDMRYPLLGKGVDENMAEPKRIAPPLIAIPHFSFNFDHSWLRQGYRFIQNEMHGRTKKTTTYGGEYENPDKWALSSQQEVEYFMPGERLPLLCIPGDSVRYDFLGKEMDVTMESMAMVDQTFNGNIELDISILPWPPQSYPPYPSLNTNDVAVRTHVTSKIVRYPAFVKSVATYADGVYRSSENVAFDPATGGPLITHTVDGYNGLALDTISLDHSGSYYRYTFPAHYVYPELGQKSVNERAVIESGTGVSVEKKKDGPVTFLQISSGANSRGLSQLFPGDFIELAYSGTDTYAGLYHVDRKNRDSVFLLPVAGDFASPDTNTGTVDVRVLRSGRLNALQVAMGGLATYGEERADVLSAANFDWSSLTNYNQRLDFVGLLNVKLAGGGDTITWADSTLTFYNWTTDSCQTFSDIGQIFKVLKSGDSVFVGDLYYLDTLVGKGGYFALDSRAQLVFRSADAVYGDQPMRQLQFCPEDLYVPQLHRVIGAGAVTFTDDLDYDSTRILDRLAEDPPANPFETGLRGRWNVETDYIYRADVVGSSRHNTTQRIYNDAGIFNDFFLFNWRNPGAVDTLKWIRGGAITKYNPERVQLESRNPLGIYSAVRLGYDDLLPLITAYNADRHAIDFTSFEDQSILLMVTDQEAHAGHRSLLVNDSTWVDILLFGPSQQLADKGALIKFWLKASDEDILLPSSPLTLNIKDTATNTTIISLDVDTTYRVARSGDWQLFEYSIADPLFSSAGVYTIKFESVTSDPVWVDDIKVQPLDAIVACYVFDNDDYRPLAIFSDAHFGLYSQYNARGQAVRSIAETERGMKTIGDAYLNTPRVARDFNPAYGTAISGGEAYSGIHSNRTSRSSGLLPSVLEGASSGTGFELMNMQINAAGVSTSILGNEAGNFSELLNLFQQAPEQLNPIELRKLELIEQYHRLDDEYVNLQQQNSDVAGRKREIEEKQQAILQELGLDGAQMRELLKR